jgi:hypothetical protein
MGLTISSLPYVEPMPALPLTRSALAGRRLCAHISTGSKWLSSTNATAFLDVHGFVIELCMILDHSSRRRALPKETASWATILLILGSFRERVGL